MLPAFVAGLVDSSAAPFSPWVEDGLGPGRAAVVPGSGHDSHGEPATRGRRLRPPCVRARPAGHMTPDLLRRQPARYARHRVPRRSPFTDEWRSRSTGRRGRWSTSRATARARSSLDGTICQAASLAERMPWWQPSGPPLKLNGAIPRRSCGKGAQEAHRVALAACPSR